MKRFPPRLKVKTHLLGGALRTNLWAVGIDTSAGFAIVPVPEGQNPAGQTNGLGVNLG